MARRTSRDRLRPSGLALEALEERQLLAVTAWTQYARDSAHTAQSTVAGQALEDIHWKTPVDSNPQYSGSSLLVHYGTPLVTLNNTVLVPELDRASGGYDIRAFDGATGALKWTQTEGREFAHPSHSWIPSYSAAIAPLAGGPRLYYPGGSGTVFFRDSPDSAGAVTPGRIAFYGNAQYAANPAAFADVRISSPLTTDSQGNLFFTYRASGTNPLGLDGGIARIGANGVATYSDVGTPALDSAPALSNDGTRLYAVVNGFMVRYDSATLTPLSQVQLGNVSINSSASPTIGPDGDVYFGVLSPSVHFRGSLSHFSADLSISYTPGSFGWDDTVSIVPASMVPSYSGPSTYLLMTKYNDYAGAGGTGVNKIAIIDPKTTQIDPVTGQLAMATVLSIAGVTPDSDFPNTPGAVREWCINTAVVDPASHSIFANNEDGWLYRWDTTTNTFTQQIQLTNGIGEAYTPTVVGADGTVFAINNAILFAVGRRPTISVGQAFVAEGTSPTVNNLVFTVSLSSSSTLPITVAYSTADASAVAASDYQQTAGVLTFAPATTSSGGVTTRTVTVPITADSLAEFDETFLLNLTSPSNATIDVAQGIGTIINDDSGVVARRLFYDGSTFDGGVLGSNDGDDSAIAPDKSAYLPGSGTSSFASVSSYSRGINGIMLDIPSTHGPITTADFVFKIGNNNSPVGWTSALAPTAVVTRAAAPSPGFDRVELFWADAAISKTWLEVILRGNDLLGGSNTNTGLAASDVFFFGSAPGDSGAGNSGGYLVSSIDEISARNNPKTFTATKSDVNDFNRDGSVNSSDQILARNNVTNLGNQLKFLVVGAGGPFAPQAEAAAPATLPANQLLEPAAQEGALDEAPSDLSTRPRQHIESKPVRVGAVDSLMAVLGSRRGRLSSSRPTSAR
jgi:hypothetical protein